MEAAKNKLLVVIGGGASGFFAAIQAATLNPDLHVIIYERGPNVLGKVSISGGGRCNVTHACFSPHELIKNYPRGGKSLIGPFTKFGPTETISWFEDRGVELKTEDDGRMFPITDSSATIIDCLLTSAKKLGIEINTSEGLNHFSFNEESGKWNLKMNSGNELNSDYLILASSCSSLILKRLEELSVKIIPLHPSLFTFNCNDNFIGDLAGISVEEVIVTIPHLKIKTQGPFLITHWGFSGPAILKSSSIAAVDLAACDYKFSIAVNFLPSYNSESFMVKINDIKSLWAKKQVATISPFESLSKRLWARIVERSQIDPKFNWADLSKKHLNALASNLIAATFKIEGKSVFKEEFVTAGGVDLNEIDFKTMKLKKLSNIYVVGELINVDAVTGGFNFQNAWTTGWIAGSNIASLDSAREAHS